MKKIKINPYDVVYVPFFKDIKRVTVLQINRSTFIGLDDLGEKEVFFIGQIVSKFSSQLFFKFDDNLTLKEYPKLPGF